MVFRKINGKESTCVFHWVVNEYLIAWNDHFVASVDGEILVFTSGYPAGSLTTSDKKKGRNISGPWLLACCLFRQFALVNALPASVVVLATRARFYIRAVFTATYLALHYTGVRVDQLHYLWGSHLFPCGLKVAGPRVALSCEPRMVGMPALPYRDSLKNAQVLK